MYERERDAIKQTFQKVRPGRDDTVAKEEVLAVFKHMFPEWSESDLDCLLSASPSEEGTGALRFGELIDWMWLCAEGEISNLAKGDDFADLVRIFKLEVEAEEYRNKALLAVIESNNDDTLDGLIARCLAHAGKSAKGDDRALQDLVAFSERRKMQRARVDELEDELAKLMTREGEAEVFRIQAVDALIKMNADGDLDDLLKNAKFAVTKNAEFRPPCRTRKRANSIQEGADELASLMVLERAAETFREEALTKVFSENSSGRLDGWPLYPRAWSEPMPCSEGVAIRVAQFNILADGLSALDKKKGGFTESPPDSLDWQYRRDKIVAELMRHGGAPDVIAMQEVDHFADSIEPDLAKFGYEGVFVKKPNSPCRESLDPTLEDGCALFWLKEKARMLQLKSFNYDVVDENGTPIQGSKANQLAMVAILQFDDIVPLLVATSHLSAKKTVAGERQRAAQITQLLQKVRQERSEQQQNLPCVIAVDMNAAPDTSEIAPYTPEAYPAVLRDGGDIGISSVYSDILGDELPWTTWKKRGEKEAKHTIDYIFASSELQVEKVLLPPKESSIVAERFPGWNYPSDHIALMADLVLPKSRSRRFMAQATCASFHDGHGPASSPR